MNHASNTYWRRLWLRVRPGPFSVFLLITIGGSALVWGFIIWLIS